MEAAQLIPSKPRTYQERIIALEKERDAYYEAVLVLLRQRETDMKVVNGILAPYLDWLIK